MSKQKVFDLHATYSELNKACNSQSYDKIVNVANKILSKCPDEFKAFQCKVVAFIRLEKYEDCLTLINKHPLLLNHVVYEKAYLEYRLNRINESCTTLEGADSNDLKVQELKAQLDEYEEERLTNLAAVAAAAACFGDLYMDLDIKPEMYEGKFNLACYHIGCGNNNLASKYLEDAKATCNLFLSDDQEISEEEKNTELAPLKVQEAYILQLRKEEEAANQIYQSVIRQRLSDNALLAVAANNVVCINREQNIFDSRKRIKMASLDGLQYKLFARQRTNILINQGLFYWHTNQMEVCQTKLRSVMADETHPRALLLFVAQLVKDKHLSKALEMLQEYCNKLKNKMITIDDYINLSVVLTLIQLHFRYGAQTNQLSSESALTVAQLFVDLCPIEILHLPGILSTRVALYLISSEGQNSACSREQGMAYLVDSIQSALQWYETSNKEHEVYSQLLDRCGAFLLHHGQAKWAAALYEKQLAKFDAEERSDDEMSIKSRQVIVARLVRAYAQFDRPKAEQACKSLNLNDSLTDADVDTLETGFLYGAKSFKRLGKTTEQSDSVGKSIPKMKQKSSSVSKSQNSVINVINESKNRVKPKKRKIRLPKNYQPGTTPDPDRWLPRRERASYRGKRRDKRHGPIRGPQGQVSGVAEWDATTRSPKTIPSTSPRLETTTTPKQVSGAARQQQRKGRKKGR